MEKQEEVVIQNLLSQINLISKHYDKISTLTGEKFNIFSIMSMERNEVYTHSAIITELLNPNGNHGQGDIFLKAFIDTINSRIEQENKSNNKIPYLNNCDGLKEQTIKEFLDIQPSGGRIDIYITNKKQSIIIENKIDADSQENQLLRYYNYAVKKYATDFWLIYLQKTEDKHTDADLDYSCGINKKLANSIETKAKVIKITYEHEILQWLKECLKYTSNLPIIRETINQYIHLVNKITNRSNNNLMANDILENLISKNSDYINA
ncbi:MAG TPA: PD-(D/E)XK nuclease family protein, partial [Bacteroidia bacterium]|nr:PD-(D/E)XK nuclease family protein [Bacteroidia bacterium]